MGKIVYSTQMGSVQAYTLGYLFMPRQSRMDGQECADTCIKKPPKEQTSQIEPSTKKLKVAKLTFYSFACMLRNFVGCGHFMIDPNCSSFCDILKAGRPRIFVMNVQVQHFGHVHQFLFLWWPHIHNIIESYIKHWYLHGWQNSNCSLLPSLPPLCVDLQ